VRVVVVIDSIVDPRLDTISDTAIDPRRWSRNCNEIVSQALSYSARGALRSAASARERSRNSLQRVRRCCEGFVALSGTR
jgi:hypothetical protein